MPKFRKKPVEIEARQFTGLNDRSILLWIERHGGNATDPPADRPTIAITTLEGVMTAEVGDWIIRGVAGEFYPCKPLIFAATYEPV